jgi:hypothetical protein
MEQRPAQTSTVCRILVAAKIQDMEGPLARSIKLCPVADSASQQSLLTHDSPDMRSTVHPSPQELQLKRQTVIPHTTRPGTTKPPRCHPEDVHPPRHQQNTFISGWRSSASPHLGVARNPPSILPKWTQETRCAACPTMYDNEPHRSQCHDLQIHCFSLICALHNRASKAGVCQAAARH